MKYIKRCLISLLISIFILDLVVPAKAYAVTNKYGVILGDKDNNYQLVNNLVVVSPAGNLMVKSYSISKKLGLTYNYDKGTKKLKIKNPVNGKSLVFILDSKRYTYYSDKAAKGVVKTAAYKLYYDSASKSNVIHMSTLKYILNNDYYKDLADTYYADMGYNALIAYSINDYSSYDIPVTDQVINFINSKTFTTKDELLDAVRMNLVARKTGVTFNTDRSVMEEIGAGTVYTQVMDIDNKDTPKDADYLSLLIDEVKQSWSSTSIRYQNPDGSIREVKSDNDPASLTINVKYETTSAQERAVDSKLAGIIKELKLEGISDYEKAKRIHDYIINLASYDTTYEKSTTYDLLFYKSSVCEGYALTAYRLYIDAGMECKIISGKGNGEPHAWNLVKVDGKWYNIDLTWDDPITYSGEQVLRYDYFLKNERDFTEHIRNSEYNTKEFLRTYPIAEESYPY